MRHPLCFIPGSICPVVDCVRFNCQAVDGFERVKYFAQCCNARHWVYTMLAFRAFLTH